MPLAASRSPRRSIRSTRSSAPPAFAKVTSCSTTTVYRSHGGITHLPDICVNVPVFWDDEIVAWVQCYGHVEDIGGIATGSMPLTSTEIYHEGLMIPPVKLYEAGKVNDALYTVILRNSRFPESLRGDIDAEISACRLGAERLQGLCRRYGKDTVAACFARMLQRCADGLREHSVAPNRRRHLFLRRLHRPRFRQSRSVVHGQTHDGKIGRSVKR